MKIKIVNNSGWPLPKYETSGSVGMDIRAHIQNLIVSEDDCNVYPGDEEIPIILLPMERKMIPTGLFIELPEGYEAQIRPRSGLAIKHGVTVINTPGTIDHDYRGEICVLLINLSVTPFSVFNGDRIAQMVIKKCEKAEWEEVDILSDTERGSGGFNSTGIK